MNLCQVKDKQKTTQKTTLHLSAISRCSKYTILIYRVHKLKLVHACFRLTTSHHKWREYFFRVEVIDDAYKCQPPSTACIVLVTSHHLCLEICDIHSTYTNMNPPYLKQKWDCTPRRTINHSWIEADDQCLLQMGCSPSQFPNPSCDEKSEADWL